MAENTKLSATYTKTGAAIDTLSVKANMAKSA